MPGFHTVLASWDNDARVWYVETSDIPGLSAESPSFEELVEVVRSVAPDLLEGEDDFTIDVHKSSDHA